MSRHSQARSQGIEALKQVIEQDALILDALGFTLIDHMNGVRFAAKKDLQKNKNNRINAWDIRFMDSSTWDTVQPLLAELARHKQLSAEGDHT